MKIATKNWIYEVTDLNPYQIRKVLNYHKKGFIGRAWELLRKYPFTKESLDAYRRRTVQSD
jgi:hypothetical protein